MGVVRLATDRRIGRPIAMKTIGPAEPFDDLAARFLREACVQGQLEHPGIVPVYDLALDSDGAPFFTMRRVHGVTLGQVIERLRAGDVETTRQYSRRKLLSAFSSACQAVHYAHTRGVVHRDLKPANVMLGEFGEVYVLDWGVAKLVDVPDEPVPGDRASVMPGSTPGARTLAGTAMGTPGYMSPEQALGRGPIDARADVYSLGAVLFELLCLTPLHPCTTLEATLTSTVRGAEARASVRAPHLDVPPELEAICVKATALDPADRLQSVSELLDALERYLDGDRDLERRRELARAHAAAAARTAAELSHDGADANEARRRALRDVGRALALDPTNPDAMALLVRLLTEPPREVPAEARVAMRATSGALRRATARGAVAGCLAWLAFLPFYYWMGIRSPLAAMVTIALWVSAAIAAYFSLRLLPSVGQVQTLAIGTTAAACCATSAICGPYVLVPTLAVINVMLWLLVSERAERLVIVASGGLSILLPAALEWAHVLHFYNFRDGRVTILQGTLGFPPAATHAFLLAASLGLVGVAAVLVSHFRDQLTAAERRLHMQAWQLRQLVPDGISNPPQVESCPPADELVVDVGRRIAA